MKNMTLKKWILSGLSIAIGIVILAFMIYTIVVVVKKDKPSGTLDNTPTDYEFIFEGKITLNDIAYDLTLNGKEDGTFDLVANKLAPITGTYAYTQGKGYTFSFNDALGTDVRTQYDNSSKEFYFVYTLDLGAARGSGNVKLTCKDESFVQEGEPWADIPSFVGTGRVMVMVTMQIVCKADNTFRMFSTDFGDYVAEITGEYTFENGSYVFIVGETRYTTVVNEETGLHEVDIPASIPSYGANGVVKMVQVLLTVD